MAAFSNKISLLTQLGTTITTFQSIFFFKNEKLILKKIKSLNLSKLSFLWNYKEYLLE